MHVKKIEYGHGTHVGLVRDANEDSYLTVPEIGLCVVADGMGGHEAGEIASGITIRELAERVGHGASLTDAIISAHRGIQAAAASGQGSPNMGSTVVALKLDGLHYEIAWVGDSRAYLWSGALRQLTRDHSYVQLLLDAGLINESEVVGHPNRNVISQGLGVGGPNQDEVRVDVVTGELGENDTLLLCSDGLSGEVSGEVIAAILAETTDNQTRVGRLIQTALEAGGTDNITAIVVSPSAG